MYPCNWVSEEEGVSLVEEETFELVKKWSHKNSNLRRIEVHLQKYIILPTCHSNHSKWMSHMYIDFNYWMKKKKKIAKNVTGTFFSVTGTFTLISKFVTARILRHGHIFAIFVTGTKKNVTATFFGPKLSRAFFRCHGHFCENCHGHRKKCHGEKNKHWICVILMETRTH